MTAVLEPVAALGLEVSENSDVALSDGLVRAVAYADVFDFALTVGEVHRYLVAAAPATEREVETLLCDDPRPLHGRLARLDGHVTLPGRESLVAERRLRRSKSARAWPMALRYGRAIASLPFVRMVAITGALAVGNARPEGDIDYLVVTEPGRLWLTRASAIAIVRFGGRRGHTVCPNYLVAESALALHDRDLYTAHELAQMIPLSGHDVYARMREANPWVAALLPDAIGAPKPAQSMAPLMAGLTPLAERVLRSPAGGVAERWERRRKVARFRAMAGDDAPETAFGADTCKGHFESHGQRIRAEYEARCRGAGVDPRWSTDG